MAESFRIPLPFWKLQFQLLGGSRRMAGVTFAYALLVTVGAWSWSRADANFNTVASFMLNILVIIQGTILGVGGCNAVYRAVLRDYQTRMIESHRMTAMPNLTVVVGYLFGPTQQVLVLFLINVLAGIVISYDAGFPIDKWMLGHVTALSGSLTLWAMTVCAGVGLNKPISPVPGLLGIGVLSFLLTVVPAAGMMTGVYSGYLSLVLSWGSRNFITGLGPASFSDLSILGLLLVQQVFTGFWLWAAARRYRRPDLPIFSAKGGLLLLLLWTLISVIGFRVMDELIRAGSRLTEESTFRMASWIGTIIGGLIIAALAVAGTVESLILVRRGRQPRDRTDRCPPLAALILSFVILIGGLSVYFMYASQASEPTIFGRLFSAGSRRWMTAWILYTIVPTLLALVTVEGIMTTLLMRPVPLKRLGGIIILALWAGPLMIDAISLLYQTITDAPGVSLSWIWGCSPLGTIASAWQRDWEAPLAVGLAVQVIIAVVAQLLALKQRGLLPAMPGATSA